MRPLTEKQREALTFIATTIRLTQRPPTIIEVSLHMGSDNSRRGLGHIEALEKKGYLVREPGQARSIRLTPAGLSLFEKTGPSPPREIPLLSSRHSEDRSPGTIPVPGDFFGERPDFAFHLDTDAVFPDGQIRHRDILFVQEAPPSEGETAVVEDPISGILTLYTVSKRHGQFALSSPGNPERRYELGKKELARLVRGRVVGLLRSLLPHHSGDSSKER
ncbi:MAG: LexA family protein [Leptospirales bacterium]